MNRRRKIHNASARYLIASAFLLTAVAQQVFAFDPQEFRGDKIELQEKQPAKVSGVNFILSLPLGYKLLPEAKPYLKLYTPEGKILTTLEVHNGINTATFQKKIKGDKLFAELALYYCKEGEEGMCIFKTVLLIVPLDRSLPKNNLHLSYDVPLVRD